MTGVRMLAMKSRKRDLLLLVNLFDSVPFSPH